MLLLPFDQRIDDCRICQGGDDADLVGLVLGDFPEDACLAYFAVNDE
jgi:hypothetical protein